MIISFSIVIQGQDFSLLKEKLVSRVTSVDSIRTVFEICEYYDKSYLQHKDSLKVYGAMAMAFGYLGVYDFNEEGIFRRSAPFVYLLSNEKYELIIVKFSNTIFKFNC